MNTKYWNMINQANQPTNSQQNYVNSQHDMSLPRRALLPLLILSSILSATAVNAQTKNTAYGTEALQNKATNLTVNQSCTAMGYQALKMSTTGINNTALGANALTGNTATASLNTGSNNTALGFESLLKTSSGSENTAIGGLALTNNATGSRNVAVGLSSLSSNIAGNDNTAVGHLALEKNTASGLTAIGYKALNANTTGIENTATGAMALELNQTGSRNTANGYEALKNNLASKNTAIGFQALRNNTTGTENTAVGAGALVNNTTGSFNTANGYAALAGNTTTSNNTANGSEALFANKGSNNTALGDRALGMNTTGNNNVAMGFSALSGNATGSNNIAIGSESGKDVTSGSNNIYIANAGKAGSNTIRIGTDVVDQSNTFTGLHTRTFIAGIVGSVVPEAGHAQVIINPSSGELGIKGSSIRYKKNVDDLGSHSETIYSLRPVTYRYKSEFDPSTKQQYGLIAEEVEQIAPMLVVHADDQPYTVRYDAVNIMMLNELQKQKAALLKREKDIAALKTKLDAWTQLSAKE